MPPPPDIFVFEGLEQHLSKDPVTGHDVLKPSPACMKAIGETSCGHGISIVSKKVIYVGEAKETWYKGKPWSQLDRESVKLPAEESYGPLTVWIINQCIKFKCSDEVDRFKVQLDATKAH